MRDPTKLLFISSLFQMEKCFTCIIYNNAVDIYTGTWYSYWTCVFMSHFRLLYVILNFQTIGWVFGFWEELNAFIEHDEFFTSTYAWKRTLSLLFRIWCQSNKSWSDYILSESGIIKKHWSIECIIQISFIAVHNLKKYKNSSSSIEHVVAVYNRCMILTYENDLFQWG